MQDASEGMESYRVVVGVPGDVTRQHIVHVLAEDTETALYRAGVAIIVQSGVGLEAADWSVLSVQSQSEFMAEARHEAEQDERQRQHQHDEWLDWTLAEDGRWG